MHAFVRKWNHVAKHISLLSVAQSHNWCPLVIISPRTWASPPPLTTSNNLFLLLIISFCFILYFGSQAKNEANHMLNKRKLFKKAHQLNAGILQDSDLNLSPSVTCTCKCVYAVSPLTILHWRCLQSRCWPLSQMCTSSPGPFTVSRAVSTVSTTDYRPSPLGVSKVPKTQHF